MQSYFPTGTARHIASHSSFLFSLYNPSNIGPVKFEVIADQNASAVYTDEQLGPTFGRNYDLKITSPESSSSLGQTYSSIVAGQSVAGSFFTSTELFTVDHIEVFYAYGELLVKTGIAINPPPSPTPPPPSFFSNPLFYFTRKGPICTLEVHAARK